MQKLKRQIGTGGNVRTTGTTTKSAISNSGNGKAMSGAWPNHVSGCQNDRLGGTTNQCAASKASHSQEKAWRTALGALV